MFVASHIGPAAPMPPLGSRLSVGLIGGLSLSVGGHPLALPHRKARAILAYLALADGVPVPREKLAGLLWDGSEQQARGALRTTLYELRRPLLAQGCLALEEAGGALRLVPGAFDLDIAAALGAIAVGEVPAVLAAQPLAFGQILAGFEDVSEATRAWVEEVRAAAETHLRGQLDAAMGCVGWANFYLGLWGVKIDGW